jgi:DNA-binding transcriptional LysR family regulator
MAKRVGADIDPETMLVFAALAREGGVRGAARELGMPRSTVSRKLAELEASVATPLVVRTARRFSLTDVGTELAKRCEELEAILRASRELVRDAASEPTGTLRVTIAPVLGEEILAAIVSELILRHPRLAIEAKLGVGFADLRRSGIDVAIRTGAPEDATDLFALRLGTSITGCYVGAGYAKKHDLPKTPPDLADHECILVGPTPVKWSFARDVTVTVSGRLRVDNFRVARDVAARDAGVLRTASVFAEPLVARGELVPILERWWPSVPIHAVHAGPNPPPPRVRVFLEAAKKAVADALPPDRRPPRWRSA